VTMPYYTPNAVFDPRRVGLRYYLASNIIISVWKLGANHEDHFQLSRQNVK
jgi:hypothetical protein